MFAAEPRLDLVVDRFEQPRISVRVGPAVRAGPQNQLPSGSFRISTETMLGSDAITLTRCEAYSASLIELTPSFVRTRVIPVHVDPRAWKAVEFLRVARFEAHDLTIGAISGGSEGPQPPPFTPTQMPPGPVLPPWFFGLRSLSSGRAFNRGLCRLGAFQQRRRCTSSGRAELLLAAAASPASHLCARRCFFGIGAAPAVFAAGACADRVGGSITVTHPPTALVPPILVRGRHIAAGQHHPTRTRGSMRRARNASCSILPDLTIPRAPDHRPSVPACADNRRSVA